MGHEWLPDLQAHRWVADYINVMLQVLMVTLWRVNLCSFCATVGLFYTVRALCFSVTLMPSCRLITIDPVLERLWNDANASPPCAWIRVRVMLANLLRLEQALRTGLNHHDLVFSGHMTMALTIALHWTTHLTWYPLGVGLLWSVMIFKSVWIVASRSHYTLDVIVSWLLVWCLYHLYGHSIHQFVYS
jgi:hypothetical protein